MFHQLEEERVLVLFVACELDSPFSEVSLRFVDLFFDEAVQVWDFYLAEQR